MKEFKFAKGGNKREGREYKLRVIVNKSMHARDMYKLQETLFLANHESVLTNISTLNNNESIINYKGGYEMTTARTINIIIKNFLNKYTKLTDIHVSVNGSDLNRVKKSLEGAGLLKYLKIESLSKIKIDKKFDRGNIQKVFQLILNSILTISSSGLYHEDDPSMSIEMEIPGATLVFPFHTSIWRSNTRWYEVIPNHDPYGPCNHSYIMNESQIKMIIQEYIWKESCDSLMIDLHDELPLQEQLNINLNISRGNSRDYNPYCLWVDLDDMNENHMEMLFKYLHMYKEIVLLEGRKEKLTIYEK